MKITIEFDTDDVVKTAKKVAISLIVLAVLLFLILSGLVFKFSQENTLEYNWRYSQLSNSGKAVATSMQKTGEVEDSLLNNKNAFRNTKKKSSKNAFFDSVSNNHKSDKKE